MIGAIIGAVAALGAGIANGILGAKESARRDALLRRQERANRMWYDRTYNEAGRETAVGQRMRELMAEANRARQASARGKGAVMGGTTALQAAEASESNKATADLLGRLDANQEARRDRIDAAYRQRDAQLVNAEMSASAQKQANLANAVTTAGQVLTQVGSVVDSSDGSAAGESAANGGSTSSQTTWKAPKVKVVKSSDKVVKAPDPYKGYDDWRKQFDKDYFKSMYSRMS